MNLFRVFTWEHRKTVAEHRMRSLDRRDKCRDRLAKVAERRQNLAEKKFKNAVEKEEREYYDPEESAPEFGNSSANSRPSARSTHHPNRWTSNGARTAIPYEARDFQFDPPRRTAAVTKPSV
jgi:hypothetical protein